MVKRTGKYRPRRINQYTPAMGYNAGMIHEGPYDVRFGPVAVASATNIINAQSVAGGVTFRFGNPTATGLLIDNVDPINATVAVEFPYGPGFGRCLQIVASGAYTGVVVINGRDVHNQPMTETITGTGAVAAIGNKAFKYIDSIVAPAAAVTLSVGTTDKLGLPFCMKNILAEHLDGVRVGTLGTLVTPSRVDPATATTTDPRGTYDPQSTLNGTAFLSATFIPDEGINAAGNGGLHGLAHYTA